MRTPLAPLAVSLAAVFPFLSPAMAAPVTHADLSGKKFCWNVGGTETYRADGKYSSSNDGEGTWVVAEKGVQISTNQITGLADMQKCPTEHSPRPGWSTASRKPGRDIIANRSLAFRSAPAVGARRTRTALEDFMDLRTAKRLA